MSDRAARATVITVTETGSERLSCSSITVTLKRSEPVCVTLGV